MERQLKERLIGATVLLVIANILVPPMFSGAPSQDNDSQTNPVAPDQLKTYEIDLQASSVEAGQGERAVAEPPAPEPRDEEAAPITAERSGDVESAKALSTAASSPVSASVPAVTASSSGSASGNAPQRVAQNTGAATPTPQTAKPAQSTPPAPRESVGGSGRFTVQVGSFGAQDKAQQIVVRIQSLGVPASVTPIKAGGKTLYRVRTGTFAGRSAAESALKKLKASYPDAAIVPVT